MAEPIKYESALPALMMQLLGTKQTTSGGTATTSQSETSTANTDPLMQIFGQQMQSSTPAGMEALIASIFEQGANKVPGLTQQYANASGSRVGKNSGLQLALAELNRTLGKDAAALVLDQQAKTSNTAAAIAQATKGNTTTQNRTTPSSTVRTGNPAAAGGLGLAGFGLNAADKLGVLDMFKNGKKGAGGVAGTAGTSSPVLDANALTAGYDSYDFQGPLAGYDNPVSGDMFMPGAIGADGYGGFSDIPGGSSVDFDLGNMAGSGVNFGDFGTSVGDAFGGIDWSNGFASSGGVIDEAASSIGYDAYDWGSGLDAVADTGGGFFDAIGDMFSGWFADGGLVQASKMRTFADGGLVTKNEKDAPKPKTSTLFSRRNAALEEALEAAVAGKDANSAYQMRLKSDVTDVPVKKADGGIIRNKNNMGAPAARYGTGVVNFSGERPAGYGSPAAFQAMPATRDPRSVSSASGGSLTSGQLQSSPALLELLLQNQRDTVGNDAEAGADNPGGIGAHNDAIGSVTAGELGMSLASVIGGMALGPLGGMAVSALGNALGGPQSLQSQAVNSLSQAAQNALGIGVGSSTNAGGLNAVNGMDHMSDTFSSVNANNPSAVGGFGGSAVGDTGSDAGMGGGIGGGGNSAGEGNGMGGTGTGGIGADGSEGSTGMAADGGHIKGPGTGISDSIPARLSDGEFVISKDVVDMVGVDFLQNLQDLFHTPAAIQKLQHSKAA